MSVEIDTTLQTYLAAVTVPGDFSGLPDGDFEVALGSYARPGTFQAPDAVSINGTVSVTLTGRLGAGKSFDPVASPPAYYLWGRATRSPDETLTRGSTRITVVTTGGTPVGPAIRYVPQQVTAPDPTVYEGWLDSSTSPPTLKGWNGTAWVAIGGGGGGGVTTFNTRAGVVSLTKADVTGTGLAASDVGADTAAARDAAILTQHTTDLTLFQPTDADLTTIAALDATVAGAMATDGAGWIRKTYAQLKTALGLVKADVGLGSVDNTADASKPVSTLQAAADAAVQAFAIQRANHTGTQSADTIIDGTTNKVLSATDKTRLANTSGTNTGDQTLPTTLPPNGAAGGDLSGTYPNPGVAKVNGTSLAGLATGLLKNTTTTGVPSIAAAADVPTVAAGGTGALSATDGSVTNSRAPSGSATGDLSGTYPAPTVAKINGVALSGLATGLLKNTTTTGAPSIAVAADIPNIAESQVTNLTTDLAAKAPLASPTFTGTPAAPTPTAADNSTKLATTAYVDTADALAVLKSTATTKGDMLVATGSAVIVRKGVGSDGQVLTADAASTGGVKWAAAAGSSLLALVAYNPGTPVAFNGTSTTLADIDATNLAVTFTVPASGQVLVGLYALWVATANVNSFWALRNGSTEVTGSNGLVGWDGSGNRISLRTLITGLTPGASLTWKWAYRTVSGSVQMYYGDNGSSTRYGPSTMEVWSA